MAQLATQPAALASGGDSQAPAGPPFKVYCAGVPKNFTAEDLQPYFDRFGPIESTVILIEKGGTGLSRGCAFVNFSTYDAAMASISALDSQVILPGGPYNLRVRFANRPGTDARRPVTAGPAPTLSEVDRRRVFFTRGPPGVVKETIDAAFSPYGEIEETNLFPDKVTALSKGCGFVTFKSQEQAQNAMNALSGALTLPGVTQPLTVSWADPERRAALKRKFAGEPEPERQVFFAKIPRAATEADVMALFAGLGAVEDVVLFKASGAQHHKGCGLATFADHQSAADAILALDGVYMWPNFHDPMVVKWMDRSMQKARRPDGSWVPNAPGGQQPAYGAPGAAPGGAGQPVVDQQAVQAAQQAAQQAWQQRVSGNQQAPAVGSYGGAYAPQYGEHPQQYQQQQYEQTQYQQPQYQQPQYDVQPQYGTQQYSGQQSSYGQQSGYARPPTDQYATQPAYGQLPPVQQGYNSGYVPATHSYPPAQGYQDTDQQQQYAQPAYSTGSEWHTQPPGAVQQPPPGNGHQAPSGYAAPAASSYGAPPAGGSMYGAMPPNSAAPPPSGPPPGGPPPALQPYSGRGPPSYGYPAQAPQAGPHPGGGGGGGGYPPPTLPLFPIQGGVPAPSAGSYGGGPALPAGSHGGGPPPVRGPPPAAPPPGAYSQAY